MRHFRFVTLAITFAVLTVGWGTHPANAQITRKVYAVKFLCGSYAQPANYPEGPVKPGNYQTAINVHNPKQTTVVFYKKAVLLFNAAAPPPLGVFEQPMPPRPKRSVQLLPDYGLEIDCPDIRAVLLAPGAPPAPTFIKGFVVLEIFSNAAGQLGELDVVAAYTSHTFSSTGAPVGFDTEIQHVLGKVIQ